MWGDISLWLWIEFPWWIAVSSIFSCACWPCAFPLLKNVYSVLLSIFFLATFKLFIQLLFLAVQILMYLCVAFFEFALVRVCWASWIYIYVFHKYRTFLKTVISSNIFFCTSLFPFSFWDFSDTRVRLKQNSWGSVVFFLTLFFLSLDCTISVELSSTSLTVASAISTMLSNPSSHFQI